MKVKVGDQVKILAGKDRNKEGKIIKTLKKKYIELNRQEFSLDQSNGNFLLMTYYQK